jgi:ATP-dependent helicase/nuclease subunit A
VPESGRLDLLINLGDVYATIDHKSFPGSMAIDEDVAARLSVYARAIERVTGRTRCEYWIHRPIAGGMSRIEFA